MKYPITSFDVAGGTLHIQKHRITIEGYRQPPIHIPIHDILSCSSKQRTLHITYNGTRRIMLILKLKSMPAAAAQSAIMGVVRGS